VRRSSHHQQIGAVGPPTLGDAMQFDLEVTSQTVCDRLGDPGGVAEKRLVHHKASQAASS
jgi:hypothetical protein